MNRKTAILVASLALPVLLVTLWGTLTSVAAFTAREYLAHPDQNARIVMTLGSFDVADKHFPWGAGFGRFGSYVAQIHYSPEYVVRNFSDVWGLGPSPGDDFFLTDTMWPALIGEGGYVGAACFAIGLVAIYRSAHPFKQTADPDVRWLALVVGGWSIELLFESVAMAVYTGPPIFPWLFGIAGVLHAVRRQDVGGRLRADATARTATALTATARLPGAGPTAGTFRISGRVKSR